MKILVNKAWGGFDLCDEVVKEWEERTGQEYKWYSNSLRSDPTLVEIVEKHGLATAGSEGLEIVEVPDGIKYVILDYDGVETVVEVGHFW